MQPTDNLHENIAAVLKSEQPNLKVASYDDVVMNRTFKARTRGYWAGTTIGLGLGLAVGALGSFIPAVLGVMPFSDIGAATILTNAAIGGAAGTAMGVVGGHVIGASAGAAAGAMQERERRDKIEKLQQKLVETAHAPPAVARAVAERAVTGETSPSTYDEAFEHSNSVGGMLRHIFNPKTMLIASLLGAIVGAVGAAAAALNGATILGFEFFKDAGISIVTKMAAGAGVGALMGSSFGINFPMLFTSLAKVSGKTLSGEIHGSPYPRITPSLSPQLQQQAAAELEQYEQQKNFAARIQPRGELDKPQQPANFQALLTSREGTEIMPNR